MALKPVSPGTFFVVSPVVAALGLFFGMPLGRWAAMALSTTWKPLLSAAFLEIGAPWRWVATGARCSDLASELRFTCPTMFSGSWNTGALTTLEPVAATAGTWPANGAAARPAPRAAAAVAIRSLDRMKGTLKTYLPEQGHQCPQPPPTQPTLDLRSWPGNRPRSADSGLTGPADGLAPADGPG